MNLAIGLIVVVLAPAFAFGIGPPKVPKAPQAGPSAPPFTPPAPKAGGNPLSGGATPLGRKLRTDPDRLREAREADDAPRAIRDVEATGRMGDRLELDLASSVAGTWAFEAVAGTKLEFTARIEGGRGSARFQLHTIGGGKGEDVVVPPGKVVRLDSIVAVATGLYRVVVKPEPGEASGRLIVTTRAKPPVDKPTLLELEAGRPAELVLQGMTGRKLRLLSWTLPRTAVLPRPFVDLVSPSGKSERLEARVVDAMPMRIVIDDVALDELGPWTLRIADMSRETRAGMIKLDFAEPAPGRGTVTFE